MPLAIQGVLSVQAMENMPTGLPPHRNVLRCGLWSIFLGAVPMTHEVPMNRSVAHDDCFRHAWA